LLGIGPPYDFFLGVTIHSLCGFPAVARDSIRH
jgi:hypothetical protein